MKYEQLRNKIKDYPIFTLEDVFKWFPKAHHTSLKNQLSSWTHAAYLQRIKRGLYKLAEFDLKEPFILANLLYFPSYISLETALNYHGIIPDIPFSITSITTKKTAQFKTKDFGVYSFRHIKPDLFFGFDIVKRNKFFYNIALPEKALFDFLYLNFQKIEIKGFPEEFRFDFGKKFGWSRFKKYTQLVKAKKFKKLTRILLDYYA